MPSVVLITGAATGIGNLTARALGAAGHTVYASMRDVHGRNAERAAVMLELAKDHGIDIRVVELDVESQDSADGAVESIIGDTGQLDVVVHNAGHLFVGYVEAFTADDVAHLFNINAIGIQRVNRAALPHMRERRSGTLVYVGSTTTAVAPPFLGPYGASKAAGDALAVATAYEVSQFGVESTIVMPGPFTKGTMHFPNASQASDTETASAYAVLDPLVARNEEATARLFPPGSDPDPVTVADEIVRILSLPPGSRPFRTVVDFTHSGVEDVNRVMRDAQESFVTRLGFAELLHVRA